MLPYLSLIPLDRQASAPLSAQIVAAIIRAVKGGVLSPGAKLPGSRTMAALLGVHRKTVITAYDELMAQGWLEGHPSRGTFVSRQLPDVKPRPLDGIHPGQLPTQTGFSIHTRPHLAFPVIKAEPMLTLDDGFPDGRLAPLDALARSYRRVLQRGFQHRLLSYADTNGSLFFRQQLARYLHDSRGIAATPDHLFTTRGSVMGIYLVSRLLLQPGDGVVIGDLSYRSATMIFDECGARLLTVPVDGQGIRVDALEELCRKQPVRMVYVTPHHHYPTTVTLSAERRIRLLQLAEEYRFAILEDDYDYDFHYASSPILPLASADASGMVIYIGSFTKTIAPAFRVGYVVAPPNLIAELGYLRRIIDRQGDAILEQALAELLAEGDVQRHLKKAQRIYHQRRDTFSSLLREHLGEAVTFDVPDGGMAVWTRFDEAIDLPQLAERCRKNGLSFNNGQFYHSGQDRWHHTRLGFASKTVEELEQAVGVLGVTINAV